MTDEEAVRVAVGTRVKLTGFEPGEEEVLRIVPDGRAALAKGEVPARSLLGRAILGAKAGDTVQLQSPVGETELTILDVGEL